MDARVSTLLVWLAALMVSGCTLHQSWRLERRHGPARVQEREVAAVPAGAVDYWSDVRPILESRCVVCHACYDAACQLKLGSTEGIDRGGSKDRVYDALRLRQAPLTRLFEDAQTTRQWRKKEFHPVLNEREQNPRANRDAGVMLRLLELKQAHPVDAGQRLPEDVDISLKREQSCPTAEEFPRHSRMHPDWGMPFGLTGLSADEHEVVVRWLEEGATHVAPPPLSDDLVSNVTSWEAFLNGDSLKEQLASRYIYEHLFLAHVYFGPARGADAPQFFELVRSKTPPGQPVQRIATRRPFDSPRVKRPYYRLVPVREAIVAKLHLPYLFDDARMKRWRELLLEAPYEVTKLPSYKAEVASNPFKSFRAIPVPSRYRFMLDEAEFTLMGFIKGSVCRGPVALNVIDDHFYIFFKDPDTDSKLQDAEFLFKYSNALRMPAASGSNAPPVLTWLTNAMAQKKYMKAKHNVIAKEYGGKERLAMDRLWDGDGQNPNAVLTVFRHFDSASVVRGMVGERPKTAWVLDYALLERIHYLLVAGFDVFGNVGHQLNTRTYMDFLRMESEFAFLAFLPQKARERERDFWYRGTDQPIYSEVVGQVSDLDQQTAIDFETRQPKIEFYSMLRDFYAPVDEGEYSIRSARLPAEVAAALDRLGFVRGLPASRLPQVSFLLVTELPGGPQVFTVIHNNAHLNISSPLDEQDRRVPKEDTLTVTRGVLGTYPNALFVLSAAKVPPFVEQVERLGSEADYLSLVENFGVRRTDPELWETVDKIHELFRELGPVNAGLVDLSRLEDR